MILDWALRRDGACSSTRSGPLRGAKQPRSSTVDGALRSSMAAEHVVSRGHASGWVGHNKRIWPPALLASVTGQPLLRQVLEVAALVLAWRGLRFLRCDGRFVGFGRSFADRGICGLYAAR